MQIRSITALLLIFTLIQLLSNNALAQCHIDDWTALKALYGSTDGDNWTNNTGWEIVKGNIPSTNCDLNLLFGVSLDSIGRVECLDLDGEDNCAWNDGEGNNLTGNIPAEIGNLSNLSGLYFDSNQLNGTIPPEIGKLSNLTELFLRRNPLTGTIPPETGNLTNLKILALNENKISGNIPRELGKLASLEVLVIVFNELSGSIPPELGNLSNLIELHLKGNKLSGSIPPEFGRLKNLTHLTLFQNLLTGIIPLELGKLANLNHLWLDNNKLEGSIPPELGNLNKLWFLVLKNNQLFGKIPKELGNMSSLVSLSLAKNQFSNCPADLGKLGGLTNLNLSGNQLAEIPVELSSLSKLSDLNLSGNQLVEISEEFSNLNMLSKLNLSENQISEIPSKFGSLSNLKKLDLSGNQLSEIPIEFSKLSKLVELDLSENQISQIPNELNKLSYLSSLNLSNNLLSRSVPKFTTNLQELNIEKNYFTCQEVQTIIEQHNQISNLIYQPQYFTPSNYNNIVSNIFDNEDVYQTLPLKVGLSIEDTQDLTYQWNRNGRVIPKADKASYSIDTISPINAGKYTLHIKDENCLIGGNSIEFISDPMYVIIKGFDLYGQPAVYDQVMVEFDNKESREKYERTILNEHGGYVADACKCNRELYLWQFPSTEAAAAALLLINKKLKRIKRKSDIDGGFNNTIDLGLSNFEGEVYKIFSQNFKEALKDSVTVYLLDSGLDQTGFNATPFLKNSAPADSCYQLESTSGFGYISNSVSINFTDSIGHGTYGFRAITESIPEDDRLKIIPLKVFNENGEGNLFKLVCGIYHAIDHKANIINISAGYQGQPSYILENAIEMARKKGIFIVTSAGNDGINLDDTPQYPAWYAGQYNVFERTDDEGIVFLDSLQYDNVISVASINNQDQLCNFSNYGKNSITLSTYGEKLVGYGLANHEIAESGTSMSAFYATKALALEIADNRNRTYQNIWIDFENNLLVENYSLIDKTMTGKHINFQLEKLIILDDGIDHSVFSEFNFDIQPNPSPGEFVIHFNQSYAKPIHFRITDISGKEIQSASSIIGEQYKYFNLSQQAKGIYIIILENEDSYAVKKLLLK